jgi:hypothetical protein
MEQTSAKFAEWQPGVRMPRGCEGEQQGVVRKFANAARSPMSKDSSAIEQIIEHASETISDLAKAEQERQKTTRELIQTARAAGAYFGPHFQGALSEFGKMIGDSVAYWRFLNLNRILKKVERKTTEGGIHPDAFRQLGVGESIRLIEAASAEEEEVVQELWARLIANALQPDRKTAIRKVYVDLLTSLSSTEVLLLDLLSFPMPPQMTVRDADPLYRKFDVAAESGWRQIAHDERRVAIQNLVRLRCVTFKPQQLHLRDLFTPIKYDARQCTVDAHKFERLLRHLGELIDVASGLSEPDRHLLPPHPQTPSRSWMSSPPELSMILTPLGKGLMFACRETRTEESDSQAS